MIFLLFWSNYVITKSKRVLLGGIEPLSGNSALNYPLSLTNFVQSSKK